MFFRVKLRNYFARRLKVPEIPFALERLCAVGFQPTQIFDVGAYQGEFSQYCLSIWPNAKVACFEALEYKVLDQALWQADFIFVPRNSPLRFNKRWTA